MDILKEINVKCHICKVKMRYNNIKKFKSIFVLKSANFLYKSKMNQEYTITSRTIAGKEYNVCYSINEEFYTCDCPDFFYRRKDNNEMCKHIELIKELDDKNVSLRVYKKNGVTLKNTLFKS